MKRLFSPTGGILIVFALMSFHDILLLVYQFIPGCTQGACAPLWWISITYTLSLPSLPFTFAFEHGFISAAPALLAAFGEDAITYALSAFIILKFIVRYVASCLLVILYCYVRKEFFQRTR